MPLAHTRIAPQGFLYSARLTDRASLDFETRVARAGRAEPMTAIAARFGVSGSHFSRVCTILNVSGRGSAVGGSRKWGKLPD